MSTGLGIFLIAAGAILVFALSSGSPSWLNLRVVGVVLILAGVTGMMLPRLKRNGREPGLMRRWLMPVPYGLRERTLTDDEGAGDEGLVREFGPDDPPTLADDLLSLQHDPPL
jgi:hypothetical protein